MISPLDKISPIAQVGAADKTEQPEKADRSIGSFGSIFQSAIDKLIATDQEKTKMEYQLAVGELDNPALLTIASAKYQVAVDLLVQLRNKAVDAYSELTRISL